MKDAQRDPKWDVLNIALGDSAGILKLNLMEKSVFNSFLTPSSSETKLWEDQNLIKTTLDVEINTLNNVIPGIITKYQIRNFFLKMDTQGFDMNVFRGASDFYGSIVGLQSELPIKKIYEQAASLTDALDEYQAAGYEVSALYPVNPDFAELIEMDCYMTKSTLVSVR